MTSVDTYVKDAILAYPGLFSNRFDVLHHTLAVIGNGAGWDENTGEIYYKFPEDMKQYVPRTREQVAEFILGDEALSDEINSLFEDIISEALARESELVTIMDEVDSRKNDMTVAEDFTVYPQSDYALIMNIPDNVSDDWKAVCDEFRLILISYGWEL